MNLNTICPAKGSKIYYKNSQPSQKLVEISLHILQGNKLDKLKKVKSEKGREVYKYQLGNQEYYFKRYCYRSLEKKVKGLVRLPEAVRALKMSFELEEKGIPVVKHLAAVSYRFSFFITDSILITRGFEGDDLDKYLTNSNFTKVSRKELIKKLADIWVSLYNNRILNGDPNLPGIMLNTNEKGIKLALLDMDNYCKLPCLTRQKVLKNLISFNAHSYSGLAGSKNILTTRDRILFFKELLKKYRFNNLKLDDLKYIADQTVSKLTRWGRTEALGLIEEKDINKYNF